MQDEGCEVLIPSMSFTAVGRCASCDGLQETTRKTSHYDGGSRTTRAVEMPYCQPCAERLDAAQRRRRWLAFVLFMATLALGVLGVLVPWLPFPALLSAPTVLAVAVGLLFAFHLGPERPPPPATAIGEAVWIRRFGKRGTTFYCTNLEWGRRFASLNGVEATVKRRSQVLRGSAWGIGLFVTLPASIAVAFLSNPSVRVDNATASPVQVWLDGKPVLVAEAIPEAPPGPGRRIPLQPPRPEVRVPFGGHTLGYSPVGASAPAATAAVFVAWNGDHLYNPGKAACHWLDAAAYGKADASKLRQGPQPVQEFYEFDRVNNWFKENPPSISTKSGGETRVALHRWSICTELFQHGCSVEARDELIRCAQRAMKADDKAAFDACIEAAVDGCAKGGIKE